jgi:CHASE3 domain sensor protein
VKSLFRNLTPRQLVVIGLIVPFICTVIVGWFQWHAVSEMVNGRVIGRQLRNTQVDLGVFRYALSDAESCQFRYILSHDSDELTLYSKLLDQATDRFAKLRAETAEIPLQQQALDKIEPLLKAKEAAADQSFALEQKGDHAGAMQIISSDTSRQNMHSIEDTVDSMTFIQAQLVLQRQFASSHMLKVTALASVAGLVVNLVCIATVLLLIRRLQQTQSTVIRDALRELVNYEDGNLTIEEYLSRRAAALSAHGQAQIEAEKLLSQLERRKPHRATQRVPTNPAPPR